MKNWKIGAKITLGFGCLFVLLLVIAITAVSFTAFTGSNIEQMEIYSGLQNSANELMHILNETRVTAGAFYATHSAATYDDVTKQLLYCDLRLKKLYEYLDANPAADAFRVRVESFETLYAQWRDGLKAFSASYDFDAELTPEQEDTFSETAAELRKVNLLAHEILSNMDSDVGEITVKKTNQTKETGVYSLTIVIAISAVALFAAIGIAVFLIRSITGPIGKMRDVLSRIGRFGDLRIPDDEANVLENVASGKDETGQCMSALMLMVHQLHEIDQTLSHVADGDLTVNPKLQSERDTIGLAVEKMLINLRQKFGTIAESTGQVNMQAKVLSEDSQLLEQGAQQQAVSIGNLSESVTRVRQKAEENTGLAQKAAELTSNIQSNAHIGSEKMNQMIQATADINEASQAIGKVLRVIEDIAFQTNILALNAAVEAAHAGQHGKGFAVVADEVRSLATKSAAAAKETGELIENTMQKAALGASIAEETSNSLKEIVLGVENSGSIMSGISALSRDQSDEILRIVENVGQVEQIVEQNSSIASRSANAATDISDQSDMLNGLIEQFKLANPGISHARLSSGK